MNRYEKPALRVHGSLTELTLGDNSSRDVDGVSGMRGNASMSDTTMGNGGSNDGSM